MIDLVIVGGGRMGAALLGGLLEAGTLRPEQCAVVEANEAVRAGLVDRFPGVQVGAVAPSAVSAAVLAVKPADVESGCAALGLSGVKRLISILAGTPIARLEALLPAGTAVMRAMPNTPALLGEGATAIAGGSSATEADLDWAEGILGAVGSVAQLPEELLDAVTGLSGSGPAYVFLVAEALIAAGVTAGLDAETSRSLALQTILGAARMLVETSDTPLSTFERRSRHRTEPPQRGSRCSRTPVCERCSQKRS